MLKSTLIGAVSGAASFGVGQLASQMFTGICASTSTLTASQVSWIVAAPQAVMHGISQGFIAGISGGDLGQAFFSGMISSGVSSVVQMGGSSFMGNGDAATLLFGTVSGGLSAELTGGNFWEGAATGLTVSGLNHVMHKMEQRNFVNERLDAIGRCGTDVPNISKDEVDYLIDNDPTLNIMHNGAGKPRIDVVEKLSKGRTGEAATYGQPHQNKFSHIELSHKAFKNYYYLYQSIGHELYHGLQYLSGEMGNAIRMYGQTSGEALMEADAYMWNYKQDTTWFGLFQKGLDLQMLHLNTFGK